MSQSYYLYLDTSVTPDALKTWLVEERGFEISPDWHTTDGTPMLIGAAGVARVEPPDPDNGGPHDYKQDRTLFMAVNSNNQVGAFEFLLRIVGDVLQHCPGDAAVEHEGGSTIVLRRGETVWIKNDPFTREYLFAGSFRPVELLISLPLPDKDEAVEPS